jgi:signal peptidase I
MLSLNEKDISMIPTISGGRRLLVDTWVGEDAPYDVGQIVLYGASIEGRSSKVVRIGRIEAKGGDVVEEREGTLWVGDRDLMAVSGPGLSPGKALEPGTFLVLVDNPALRLGPDPRGYPDSRQLGPVVEEDIVGRFIIQF